MTLRKALLVVHTGTFMTEIGQLADRLLQDGRYAPELMIYPYALAGRDAKRFSAMTCLDHLGAPFSVATRTSLFSGIVRRTLALLARSVSSVDYLSEMIGLSHRRRQIGEILRDRKPDIVALGGDMVGYDTAAFIDACHQQSIPVLVVPSTMSNGLEQAEVYSADPRHQIDYPLNRRLASLHPKWRYVHNGKELVRERGARGLAMERLGIAPPLPWVFNSGNADAIAIESEAMKNYYRAAGLDGNHLILTGSPSDDAIFDVVSHKSERRAAFCASLGFAEDKTIFLSALPPDSLYMTGGRPQCDFRTYSELVQFWMSSLSRVPNANMVVCVHPSVSPETVRKFETANLRVVALPTAQLVPLSDVFVASVSSTIRWAIACGVPVVNYDVYRYRYTDFLGLAGVLATEEKSEFINLLTKMGDPTYRTSVATAQQADARSYGTLDGKAVSRIIDLMNDLIATRRARVTQSSDHVRELIGGA